MAKTKRSSGGRRDAAHGPFDAKRFRSPRIQATFDYDELSLMRAANQLGQVGRNVVLAVAFVSLVCVIATLLVDPNSYAPAIAALLVAVAASAFATRWDRVQLRLVRGTSLDVTGLGDRRRVTVTDDSVHLETTGGVDVSYPLSDLSRVYATDDSVTACFAKGRYVYVPRSALSENRFHELVRILKEAREKGGRR